MLTLLIVSAGTLALLYGVAAVKRRLRPPTDVSDFQLPPGRDEVSLRALFGQRLMKGPEEFEVIRPGLVGAPLARLLFRDRPSFTPAALQAALSAFRPDATLEPTQNATLPVLFSGVKCSLEGRILPTRVLVSPEPFPLGAAERTQLTFEPTACDPYFLKQGNPLGAVAESCAWELHVYANAGDISARLSLNLLLGVTACLAKLTRPDVIYWQPAKKLIAPADLEQALGTDDVLPLVTTLRRAALASAGAPPTFLIDTMGLAEFSLPDVQLHFNASLDPGMAAATVFAVAMEVWRKELSIGDGDSFQLPDGPLKFVRARYAQPRRAAQEHRVVLDLDPGDAYSAARRAPIEGEGSI